MAKNKFLKIPSPQQQLTLCLGFNLWTSAHGFHHLSLTQSKGWKCFWGFILLVLSLSLIGCIIFYFYFVFSSAIYSRCQLI